MASVDAERAGARLRRVDLALVHVLDAQPPAALPEPRLERERPLALAEAHLLAHRAIRLGRAFAGKELHVGAGRRRRRADAALDRDIPAAALDARDLRRGVTR